MANSANYFGFMPYRHLGGGVIRPSERRIASAYAANIFSGDAVKLVAGGGIEVAAAGARILGIFHGCSWVDSDGTPRYSSYWPASTATLGSVAAKAFVYDDPNMTFQVRSGGTPALADVGLLADHVAGTGSTTTGRSGDYLSGTMATGTASFRILDFVQSPANEVGQYAILEVQPFEFELVEHGQGTPGV